MFKDYEEMAQYFIENKEIDASCKEDLINHMKRFEEYKSEEGIMESNELLINTENVDKDYLKSINQMSDETKPDTNNISCQEEQVYYISQKENWEGKLYKLDKQGNIIDCYNFNLNNDEIKNIKNQVPENRNELIELLSTYHEEYNFKEIQDKLTEEIKCYPEINEKYLKLINPKQEQIRFSSKVSLLRTLLEGKNNLNCKMLISILEYYDVDYFKKLINDGILKESNYNQLYNYFFRYICDFIAKYNILPTIKIAVSNLDIPYSKEFFDDFILERTMVDEKIKSQYIELQKNLAISLSQELSNRKITFEDYTQRLNEINQKYSISSINDNFDELKEIINSKEEGSILSTGIKEFDDNKVLLQKGKVATVLAYTGDFKTMFSTNVAYHNIQDGKNVLYLSLEIAKEDMYCNFISRHSYGTDNKISHSDLKLNKLEDENYEKFNKVYDDFKAKLKSHLLIIDETDIKNYSFEDMDQLLSLANTQFINKTNKGIDLIIVDHLNLFKFGALGGNDYSIVNHWMSYFRSNSINFLKQKQKVATLCVCQSSRDGYRQAQKDKEYSLTSIAEGNEIERASSLVLSIFTDNTLRNDNEVYLQVLKLRDQAFNNLSFYIGIRPEYYTFGVNKDDKSNLDFDYSNYENNIKVFEEEK